MSEHKQLYDVIGRLLCLVQRGSRLMP